MRCNDWAASNAISCPLKFFFGLHISHYSKSFLPLGMELMAMCGRHAWPATGRLKVSGWPTNHDHQASDIEGIGT